VSDEQSDMPTPEWQRRIDEAPDGTPAGVLRQWWQDVGCDLNGKSVDHELPYREIVEVVQEALGVRGTGNEGAGPPCPRCGKPMERIASPEDYWDDAAWVWGCDCEPT
jgi:hypothetical protein